MRVLDVLVTLVGSLIRFERQNQLQKSINLMSGKRPSFMSILKSPSKISSFLVLYIFLAGVDWEARKSDSLHLVGLLQQALTIKRLLLESLTSKQIDSISLLPSFKHRYAERSFLI